MADLTEIDSLASRIHQPRIVVQDGIPLAQLPPGWTSENLEHLLPAPVRLKERATFRDVDSLAFYAQEFLPLIGGNFRVFSDERSHRIQVILDPNMAGKPSHQEHIANLELELSPEWKTWKETQGSWMSTKDFTRFIENHMEEIVDDEFSGSRLLAMCRDLRAHVKADVHVEERPGDGQRSLNISASQGLNGNSVTFPEHLKIQMRVFVGEGAYEFTARLRWDVSDREGVQFAVDLRDPVLVEEQAFNAVVEKTAEALNCTVLRGFI